MPAASAFAFDPSDANRIYMRTTFGLLVAADQGHTWDWICERSLGSIGPEDPTVGVFADGTLAATLTEGLSVTHDHACTFGLQGGDLANRIFVDLAVRKSAPSSAVAVSSGYALMVDDAGNPLFSSQVFVTINNGATWSARGAALDPTLLVETIDWSDADPNRMYISAARGVGTTPSGVILESDDAGKTWAEHAVDLITPAERAPFIAALDPKNADVLYVRTGGTITSPSRLLVSKDAGKSWTKALAITGPMLGFALSDDGAKIFAGGPLDGIYQASTSALSFTKKNALPVQCLASHGSDLWACSDEFSGFTAGVSHDDGTTFEPRLHLRDVRGPLACPSGTPTSQLCTTDWPNQEVLLGIISGASLDAGADASSEAPFVTTGGCSTEPANGSLAISACLMMGVFGGLFFAVRARRRRGPWQRQ